MSKEQIEVITYEQDRLYFFVDQVSLAQKKYGRLFKTFKDAPYLSEGAQFLSDAGRELQFYKDVVEMLDKGYRKQSDEYEKRIVNQREELRRLNKRINDLTQSRDVWKKQAERVGKQLHEVLSKQSENVIELPCKIGDKMYFVCGYNIAEYEIYKIEYDLTFFKLYGENSNYVIEHREFVCLYPNTSQTIFFSKEEAEKALAKMKGGAE